MSIEEKNLTLAGLTVSFLQGGTPDSAVLLLHGAVGGARLCWEPALPALAETHHVIAPDLPGFGGSAALPDMRTQTLLDWLARLLDALAVGQAVIVGSSLGALLARLFAAARPDRARALVLINGGSLPNVSATVQRLAQQPVLGRGAFQVLARTTLAPAELRRAVHVQAVLTDSFLAQARASAGPFAELMRAFAADDLPEQRTPAVPTLLLWGSSDHVNTLQEAERIRAAVPGATLTPVSNCGLLLQHEAPDVFVWQINRFLADLDRPSRPNLPGVSMLGK